ncbi:unnamed protein product [Caenorhabditis brenneri]
MDKHREEKKRVVKLKKEQEKAELEEKKKQNLEKRRVVQYLHGFGGQQRQYQSGGRDNKTKVKLAAKLAERKKTNQVVNPEKEALRAQLIQEAQNAQLEMEARQAERIVLEERLRQFQARLERELVEAAEYAAQKFLEKEERREWEEKERMMRIQEEIRKEEQAQQKKLEEENVLVQEEEQESPPSPITYKQAVYARLEQYEIARFAFLEMLKKKYYEKQMKMELARQLEECEAAERKMEEEEEECLRQEKMEMNKKIVQEYLMETQVKVQVHESEDRTSQVQLDSESVFTSGAKAVLKRDTSTERALKERVLRKLKVKLEKRIMMKRQEKQEEEILKNEYAEDEEEDYGSWNREDKMEQAQYMRRGYGRGF